MRRFSTALIFIREVPQWLTLGNGYEIFSRYLLLPHERLFERGFPDAVLPDEHEAGAEDGLGAALARLVVGAHRLRAARQDLRRCLLCEKQSTAQSVVQTNSHETRSDGLWTHNTASESHCSECATVDKNSDSLPVRMSISAN